MGATAGGVDFASGATAPVAWAGWGGKHQDSTTKKARWLAPVQAKHNRALTAAAEI